MPPRLSPGNNRIGAGPPGALGRSFGVSLPIGVLLHAAVAALLLYPAFAFRAAELPPVESYRVQLFAPPAAALRLGDPAAAPDPEERAPAARPQPRSQPVLRLASADLSRILAGADPPTSFGAEQGIPEGVWDGLEFGTRAGVVGGIPGGVQGGQIGGLRVEADPILPPPDEPPMALSMPNPRFPAAALREGVRGRVVLRALITERGTVQVLRILRSVPGLDAEAIRVVESEWRFRAARRNGRPTPSLSDLVVRFTLR